ncbi:hypothetical protein FA95DRAFT_303822 [Auriscalpium vulgare]|uniref:Uncharacterized protein n=1 Tax=Auriscalpium vulgare TaxID=40419 RepID=A0ACB8RIX1_9AGAM|nr:hypothetical protein FA95DRAFT_303822 [Auriscalpium vulgare]
MSDILDTFNLDDFLSLFSSHTLDATVEGPSPDPRCHIDGLPAECLGLIFAICVEDDPPENPEDGSGHSLGWITVTHVCRRWRDVALGYPQLWTLVAFNLGDAWAQEMVARSQSAALLMYPKVDSLSDIGIDIIAKSVHRVKELDFGVVDEYDTMLALVQQLTKPALQLEDLTLYAVDDLLPIPDEFLGGSAPRLRTLSLNGFIFDLWASPMLHGLRHLEVRVSCEGQETEDVCDDILEALQAMPALESLNLGHCFPLQDHIPGHNRAGHSIKMVALPNLAYLEVTVQHNACAHVLDHLILPPAADLYVTIERAAEGGQYGSEGVLPCMPLVTTWLNGCDMADTLVQVQTMFTRGNARSCVYLATYKLPAATGHRSALLIRVETPNVVTAHPPFLRAIHKVVPWGVVTHLKLDSPLSHDDVSDIFPRITKLRRLTLYNSVIAAPVLKYMATSDACLPYTVKGCEQHDLVPQLHSINFVYVDFEQAGLGNVGLPAWCKRRAMVGKGLSDLYLNACRHQEAILALGDIDQLKLTTVSTTTVPSTFF